MTEKAQIKKIAIACQGGGSHTAFTAGVLKRILQETDTNFEIIAMSGTSGGAICALLTWYGLATADKDKAIKGLNGFWHDNSVRSCQEKWLNQMMIISARMRDYVSMPLFPPNIYSDFFQNHLRRMVEKYVDFDKIPLLLNRSGISLFVGAVNLMTGKFKIFKNREITPNAILASAAIPDFFFSVRIGRDRYWDGLFSQNPPIRELAKEKPDEIWIIQVNPPATSTIPITAEEIRERRNELIGNLSLDQEVHFIETINKLVQTHQLVDDRTYKIIKIRRIQMLRDLNFATKLDRSPDFIQDMMVYGEEQAERFLKIISSCSKIF